MWGKKELAISFQNSIKHNLNFASSIRLILSTMRPLIDEKLELLVSEASARHMQQQLSCNRSSLYSFCSHFCDPGYVASTTSLEMPANIFAPSQKLKCL